MLFRVFRVFRGSYFCSIKNESTNYTKLLNSTFGGKAKFHREDKSA